MHSKKGLPVPPGLPSPLRAFLASGGKLSPDLDQAKGPRAVHPEPRATASVPAPARLSVSDAFGSVESDITKAPQIQDAGRSVSVSDSEEVSNGVLDLTSATKKLIGTQNAALEV